MKWVTRERPKVDRSACAWLIRRFIDRHALILFVPPDQVTAVAARESAIPFDVPGAELGRHGVNCSFDAILDKYRIDDPALRMMARIVRGAETGARDLSPESPGLEAIARGFSMAYADDHAQLDAELPMYDALYAWCQSKVGLAAAR